MFYKCVKNGENIVKGEVYEGVRIDSVGSALAGYYLYCIGVVGTNFLKEIDYEDIIVTKDNPYFALGSKHRGIKIHEPLTHKNVWRIKGSNREYEEDIFTYCSEADEDTEILFISMISTLKNGETYTCKDWSISKIGEEYIIRTPCDKEITISGASLWKKEEVDTVDFIDAYKHLKDGGSAVSVLSGVKYSFKDIDGNDFQEIDIDEIKNKWTLA